MAHKIRGKPFATLVMMIDDEMLIRLEILQNRTDVATSNVLYSRWISIFDSLIHIIVDHGLNLAKELMKKKLDKIKTRLLPIPTGASWGICLNEHLYRYLQKSVDHLLLHTDCARTDTYTRASLVYFFRLTTTQAQTTKFFNLTSRWVETLHNSPTILARTTTALGK